MVRTRRNPLAPGGQEVFGERDERPLLGKKKSTEANVHVSRCTPALQGSKRRALFLEVVVHPEVRDLLFAHHPAKRVPELGLLDEQVVLGVEPGRDLG